MEVSFFIPSKRLVNPSQQISLVLAHHQSHVQIKRIHHPVAHLLIHSYLIIHDVQQNSINFINVTKKAKKKSPPKSINHELSNSYSSHYATSPKSKGEK
jgi:hypothetical protein